MGDKYCQFCGSPITPEAVTCPNCGRQVRETKFCQFCGETIDKDAVICPKCGRQVGQVQQPQGQVQQPQIVIHNDNINTNSNKNINQGGPGYPHKNKTVALLLCFFLGFLGVHRFYVGKTGTGILYLLTGGLVGIGVLIDFIMILVGAFRDKYGMPLV